MSEESKLVEEVVENTTETKESSDKFNPLAFAGDDTYNTKEEEKTEEQEEVVAESKEDTETTETTEETEEDGWSWDSKTEEKKAHFSVSFKSHFFSILLNNFLV